MHESRRPDSSDHSRRVNRRQALGIGLSASALTALPVTVAGPALSAEAAPGREGPKLVENGQARAVMVVRDDANGYLKVDLERQVIPLLQRITGATLSLHSLPSNPPPADVPRINVGFVAQEQQDKVAPFLRRQDADGWAIVPHGDVLTITGTSWWGTISGLRAWLRSLGVEWLMPTDIGTHVPSLPTIPMPSRAVNGTPAFPSRMISPLVLNPWYSYITWPRAQYLWAQDNALTLDHDRKVSFHHNMNSLFPVATLGATHPEYYSGGRAPAPGQTTGWQPVFTNPDTVTWAVQRICEYFAANPAIMSYSLGVNDGDGYDPADLAHPGGVVAAYYTWVNAVVSGVLEQYPDKWFGLLAYTILEEPPAFALHERVIPFLTQDRMAWIDPEVKEFYHGVVDRWRAVTTSMGFYDYTYGSPYMVPRMYPHLQAETFRYARDHQVMHHYDELYPYWGEGPKGWVMAQLLWDPDQDVDALLDRWYRLAVGDAAAPLLAQYYAHWEDFWTRRITESPWFQRRSTMQAFFSGGYLDLVTSQEMADNRALLEQVLALTATPEQRARAEKLLQAFEYYETSVLSYPRTVAAPASSAAALAMLGGIESSWRNRAALAQRRTDLIAGVAKDPLMLHMNDAISKWGLAWGAWNESEFWGLHDFLRDQESDGGPVTDRLQTAATGTTGFADFCRLVLQVRRAQTPNLVTDPSFEEGSPAWLLWVTTGADTLVYSTDAASEGTRAVKINRVPRGGPAQTFAARPGILVGRTRMYAPAGREYLGTAQPSVNLFDAAGKSLGKISGKLTAAGTRTGEWVDVDHLFELPAGTAKVQFVYVVNGFGSDGPVYIDEVSCHQLSD